MRDVGDRLEIGGDVLADRAVAARRALHEHAVLVAQRGRQPVDLRLGREGELSQIPCRARKNRRHALDEVDHVLVGIGLGEAEHGHRMAHLGKAFGRRRADPLDGESSRTRSGKRCFDARGCGGVSASYSASEIVGASSAW